MFLLVVQCNLNIFNACTTAVNPQPTNVDDRALLITGAPSFIWPKRVESFFEGFEFQVGDAVEFVKQTNTRPGGHIVVRFASAEEAQRAIREKHLDQLDNKTVRLTSFK